MNKLMKLMAFLIALSISESVKGSEFRAPLVNERGPLRYVLADRDYDKYRINLWSASHYRQADRAFMQHGFGTQPLSSLFFNASDFRLSKIFPNCYVPINTEFYNPFMRVMKIAPRVSYSEEGMTLGGRIDFPVYENKGRIGIRAAVPFRDIEMERDDLDPEGNPVLDDLKSGEAGAIQFTPNAGSSQVVNSSTRYAYRFDLVEALPDNSQLFSLVNYLSGGLTLPKKKVTIANTEVDENTNLAAATTPQAVMVAVSEGQIPRNKIGTVIDSGNSVTPSLTALPANLQVSATQLGTTDLTPFTFDEVTPVDYTPNSDDSNPNGSIGYPLPGNVTPVNTMSVASRVAAQDRKAQLWVTSVHDIHGALVSGSNTIKNGIDQSLAAFSQDVYDWMGDKGNFAFKTDHRQGLGDADIDIFYEHRFDKDIIAEFMVGVRLPTGTGHRRDTNPYTVHLGNSEHFEVKLGAMGVWQVLNWLNIKLDGYWSFVLENEEKRCASFAGALIKNIGPTENADIDWGYLVTRLDFNFIHPKEKNLSSLLGYEFYYRTEDSVHFKHSTLAAWFGRQKNVIINSGNANVTTNAVAGSISFANLTFPLDGKVLERNTEAFGHRARWETAYRLSRYFEVFVGGAWTFAGQNIPREMDFHGGFNIKFQ